MSRLLATVFASGDHRDGDVLGFLGPDGQVYPLVRNPLHASTDFMATMLEASAIGADQHKCPIEVRRFEAVEVVARYTP